MTSAADAVFADDVKGFGTGPRRPLQWKLDDQQLPAAVRSSRTRTRTQTSLGVPRNAGGLHVISRTSQRRPIEVDNARPPRVDVVYELKVLIVERDGRM